MKVLFLGINYPPEMIAIALYSSGVVEDLAAQGHDVQVITALPYYPKWRVFDGWRGPFWRSEQRGGARVVHCPLYVPAKPSGAKRILHHASFALSALPVAIWKAVTFRPDVVFVVAPGLVSAPVGLLAAKLARAKTWLHIQDFEVEAAFVTGLISATGRVGRAALAFERWVLGRFNRVSTISSAMIAKLREKAIPPGRVTELRNWADVDRVQPMTVRSPYREEFGITTRHVAFYSGNLANKQGIEIIPQVAALLAGRDDLTFVICGDGPMRPQLEAAAARHGNLRLFPLQPLERLGELLGLADVHLLPQVEGAADLVLPSKLTNMLSSGRPVVATAVPGSALAEEVDGAGIVTPPGDAQAMADAIQALLSDDAGRAAMGAEARKRAEERWRKETVLARFRDELQALEGPDV